MERPHLPVLVLGLTAPSARGILVLERRALMETAQLTATLLQTRLKDRDAMATAAKRIDAFRRKYGKPSKGFDTITLLRKLRQSR